MGRPNQQERPIQQWPGPLLVGPYCWMGQNRTLLLLSSKPINWDLDMCSIKTTQDPSLACADLPPPIGLLPDAEFCSCYRLYMELSNPVVAMYILEITLALRRLTTKVFPPSCLGIGGLAAYAVRFKHINCICTSYALHVALDTIASRTG